MKQLLLILMALASLAFSEMKSIHFVLLYPDGSPAGVTDWVIVNELEETVAVTTDSQGSFDLQLASGSYRLFAQSSGEVAAHFQVDPSGQGSRIELSVPSLTRTPAIGEDLLALGNYQVMQRRYEGDSKWQDSAQVFNPFQASKPRRIHGSIYEYHRNDNLDARNFFDPVGQPLPEFKRNQFGVQLGGTFDRLSVLGSYDGLRIVKGSTLVSHVPTAAMKRGDFSELGIPLVDPFSGQPLAGNQVPPERIHPISQRLLSLFPEPNAADFVRNFVNSQPQVDDGDDLEFRADYQFRETTRLVGSYRRSAGHEVEVEPLPSFNTFEDSLRQSLRFTVNHNFSQRLTSEVRLLFIRNGNRQVSANAGRSGLLESIGIPGLTILDASEEGYPQFELSGYAPLGDGDSPETSIRNFFEVESNVRLALPDHTLTFELETGFQQLNNYRSGGDRRGSFDFNGSFTGDAFADFLYGLPDRAQRAIGSDRVDLRRRSVRVGMRDDWRVSPKLNINFGLFYSYRSPYRSIHPVAGFFPLEVEPTEFGQVVISGTPEATQLGFGPAGSNSLYFPDRNDFSPRLAVAFSPRGNNRFVLRAHYSLFYDNLEAWQAVNFMGRNFPFFERQSAVSESGTPQISLSNPFANLASAAISVRGIERNIRSANFQFWGLTLQKRLSEEWNLELAYRGERITGFPRLLPGNIPTPGPGEIQARRPNPEFGTFAIISGSGSLSSHNLELDVEKQLANGYSLTAGLEWNRPFGDIVFFEVNNPRDLSSERALENWRTPFRVFANYIVDLPFGDGRQGRDQGFFDRVISGWRLTGTTTFNTGNPFTVFVQGDPNNDGISADRADRIGSGVLDSSSRSVDRWFDTSAFVAPQPFSFGNSGRNILRGPAFQAWDFALSKRTTLADGHFLELRVQLFNAFNHVNFSQPDATLGTSVFGQIFGANRSREIEVALKYSF